MAMGTAKKRKMPKYQRIVKKGKTGSIRRSWVGRTFGAGSGLGRKQVPQKRLSAAEVINSHSIEPNTKGKPFLAGDKVIKIEIKDRTIKDERHEAHPYTKVTIWSAETGMIEKYGTKTVAPAPINFIFLRIYNKQGNETPKRERLIVGETKKEVLEFFIQETKK